jgi:hypothetical protein
VSKTYCLKSILFVMDCKFVSPTNSYVKILSPDMMQCWDKAFGRWSGVDEIMRVGAPRWDFRFVCLFWERVLLFGTPPPFPHFELPNSWCSCLSFPSTGIIGVHHHAWSMMEVLFFSLSLSLPCEDRVGNQSSAQEEERSHQEPEFFSTLILNFQLLELWETRLHLSSSI